MPGAHFSVQRIPAAAWAAAIVLLVFATQLGSLNVEVLNWDETTFILMARDVLDGHLPYAHAFENKPPLIFFALAGAMAIFGENIFVARLFGDVTLAITCIAAYFVASHLTDRFSAALGAGALAGVSALAFAQHTQAEHLAMALLMPAVLLALKWPDKLWAAAAAGALVALATLTRTNLLFAVAALGLVYALGAVRPKLGVHRFAALAYIVGGLAPLAALVALYAAAGALATLWLCAVEVPAAYSTDQAPLWWVVKSHLGQWKWMLISQPFTSVPLTILVAWAAAILARRLWPGAAGGLGRKEGYGLLVVAAAGAGALAGVLAGGVMFTHYWNQLLPFAAILVAVGMGQLRHGGAARTMQQALCVAVIATALVQQLPRTWQVVSNPASVGSAFQIRRAAELIAADRQPGDAVWAVDYHLVLLYLGLDSVSRAALHPSNIANEPIIETLQRGGYVADDEFSRVLQSEPRYIVTRQPPVPFFLEGEQAGRFERLLQERYELWREAPPVYVYRRRAAGAGKEGLELP